MLFSFLLSFPYCPLGVNYGQVKPTQNGMLSKTEGINKYLYSFEFLLIFSSTFLNNFNYKLKIYSIVDI